MVSAYNKVLTAPKNLIANNIFNVGVRIKLYPNLRLQLKMS